MKESCKNDNFIKDEQPTDSLEQLLRSAYEKDAVPLDAKIRLQNRIACQKAMQTGNTSFWWLPATVATTISLAVAALLCMFYVVININGVYVWMPNLLQRISEVWLKWNLFVISFEVMISWLITFIGVWKGNLVTSARMM